MAPYENPYSLTNHDHSGLLLVSDRLTGAGDFGSWHQSMIMALNRRNKLCFVDGSLPKPDDGHRDAATWSRNNVPRIYRIEQKLAGLRQGSLDVNTFYTKLVTIWEEVKSAHDFQVCQCNGCDCDLDRKWMDLFERNFVIKFLFGLNDSYEHIRESIVMLDPLPDLEKTLNMSPQSDSGFSYNQPEFDTYSGHNEIVGAVAGGYKPRQCPVCTYYGLQGHIVTKCYKLHGYPPGYKTSNQPYGNQSYGNQSFGNQSYGNQQGVATQFVPKQFQQRPPVSFPQQQQFGQQNNINSRMQGPRGSKENVVGNIITNSPAVQDHFHQVSHALAQLSPDQIEQLATQLTTKATCQQPSINETLGVTYASTSAGNTVCTTLMESCLNFTAWIIDSGATTHVCCNLSLFADINSISETTVKLPNQSGTV
ncbi:unnamed protein product, partial [Arabidopsis halleri]